MVEQAVTCSRVPNSPGHRASRRQLSHQGSTRVQFEWQDCTKKRSNRLVSCTLQARWPGDWCTREHVTACSTMTQRLKDYNIRRKRASQLPRTKTIRLSTPKTTTGENVILGYTSPLTVRFVCMCILGLLWWGSWGKKPPDDAFYFFILLIFGQSDVATLVCVCLFVDRLDSCSSHSCGFASVWWKLSAQFQHKRSACRGGHWRNY